MILYAMAIEDVAIHVEFRDRLQTLIDCVHELNDSECSLCIYVVKN